MFSRQAEAKSGSYMPCRPSDPTVEFTPTSEYRYVGYTNAGTALVQYVPPEGITPYDLWLRGWNVTVDNFMGLDMRGNLRIKTREGLEMETSTGSSYGPFATPALPRDDMAMEVLREYSRCEPHAYPAEFNDLGKMIPEIIGGLASAIENLGIPIISPIAGGVRKVVPMAQNIFDMLF